MRKQIIAFLAALSVLAMTVVVASAETGSVTITGGSLSFTSAAVTLTGVTLNGADQNTPSAYTSNAWTAKDARGTGAGWNVTVDATNFVNAGATHTITIADADKKFKIQVVNANVGIIAGNTKPTSSATSLTDIPTAPAAALKFVSAATDEGMGEYDVPPAFQLSVPAETYADSYTSTMTITVATGP